ncbi:MAG TPA: hypothetical protein VNZ03_11020, partial [Terriglobales bacterium]|nr:hypothetical protein [Terriglobales bacterium]
MDCRRTGHLAKTLNSLIVGKPYLGITSHLPVIQPESEPSHPGSARYGLVSSIIMDGVDSWPVKGV